MVRARHFFSTSRSHPPVVGRRFWSQTHPIDLLLHTTTKHHVTPASLTRGCRTRRPMSSLGYLLCTVSIFRFVRPLGVPSPVSCSCTMVALSHSTWAPHTLNPVLRGHVAAIKQRFGPKLVQPGGYDG